MTGGSSSTSPEIPDELKGLYMQAAAAMQRGMSDMPASDFYEMPAQQFAGLSAGEERAKGAVGNLYGQSPALNQAFNIASQLGQSQGSWRGADLSQIGAPPTDAPGYPGRA